MNKQRFSVITRAIGLTGASLALIVTGAMPAAALEANPQVSIGVAGGSGTVQVGGVAGPIQVTQYSNVEVKATPAPGYQFAGVAQEDTAGWLGGSTRVRSELIASTVISDGVATANFQVNRYNVRLQALFIRVMDTPSPIVVEGERIYLPPVEVIGDPIIVTLPAPAAPTPVVTTPAAPATPVPTAPAAPAPAGSAPAAPATDAWAEPAPENGPAAQEYAAAPEPSVTGVDAVPPLPVTGGDYVPQLPVTGHQDYDADGEYPHIISNHLGWPVIALVTLTLGVIGSCQFRRRQKTV